jgi:hypothetical protein
MEKLFVAILDIAYSESIVASGEIGISRDLFNQFENIDENSIISIKPAEKPQSFQYIKKKIEGKKLNSIEINKIIEDTVSGSLSQIELSAFITGASIHGLDNEEITALTIAETMNGEILNFGTEVYDKHSTYIST